ncbi:MAG: DNA repair protein RecN [Bacteroidaceae bacterium]|nr:DNA repair protein RecN [Bacteroidaceae bacterium]MCR4769745.1 DNA repair protein RecN [Bacteroidaceae bacterium]
MIKSLNIEHYALIDQLSIDFHSGFSVITGETGAGKSIILGAIGLLLGQRADSKSIKIGEQRCTIEAVFDVTDSERLARFFEDNDLDADDNECIIRRELTATGKSRAFINDTPVSLSQLKEIGEQLIDIHSQHQNLLLNREEFQMNMVDTIAGNGAVYTKYLESYKQYKETSRQLTELMDNAKRNHDDEDYLRYQLKQLSDAELVLDEQEKLESESELLSHAEDIKNALYVVCNMITSDSDVDTLGNLKKGINSLESVSDVFAPSNEFISRLDSCVIELKDIAEDLSSRADAVEYDPARLQYINERLNVIYSLQQKFHVESVAELLTIQEEITKKLDEIDNFDDKIAELKGLQESQYKTVLECAGELTATRKDSAETIKKSITETLIQLGMPNVCFEVAITPKEHPDEKGIDHIDFLFSANKNIPPQNLTQIASGGEIARVMLALKALIANTEKLPTIIFDEIDTGVSGNIAEKMACIMAEMANVDKQVISITHLPQIAAYGKHHYKVYKDDNMFFTTTHVVKLNQAQRVEEIAHMLSGANITQSAINNAKELLEINN